MADQLFLSYRLRGFTENNMLRHYEKMLRQFPFSRLNASGSVLRVHAVSWDEPPLIELPVAQLKPPPPATVSVLPLLIAIAPPR